jgi:large subunit ribosomal protein L17
MAVIELVDYAEAPSAAPVAARQDRSKRVKGSKKAESGSQAKEGGEAAE